MTMDACADPALLPGFGSETLSWLRTKLAFTVAVYVPGLLQDTYHPSRGAVFVGTEAGNVSCVIGLLPVGGKTKQGAVIESVKLPSTVTGPKGPLLWRMAEGSTRKAVPAVF